MGLSLGRFRPKLEASWVLTVWAVVGIELLVLFYLSMISSPIRDGPLWFALQQSETALGLEGSHSGAIEPFLVSNFLLTVALWPTLRAARSARQRNLAQLCVATAVAVLLVSWGFSRLHGYVLREGAHNLVIERVFTLEADGTYSERREPADPAPPLRGGRR